MGRKAMIALNLLLMFRICGFAQDLQREEPQRSVISGRETLKGVKEFSVAIVLNAFAKDAGVNATQTQTDVELKLRSLGIHVVSEDESSKILGRPYLQITIVAIGKTGKCSCGPNAVTITNYGYVVDLSFHEDAVLYPDALRIREGESADAHVLETLGIVQVGVAEKAEAAKEIRSVVADMVSTFANNYLAENPKG